MPFVFENLALLFGLFALAVPIVLHLLQRRQSEVIDWAAMQFLPHSDATRRRRWLDEMLLLLARMAIIALIVLAFAGPIATSSWLAPLSEKPTRDIVLVMDGSFSMGQRVDKQATPWDKSRQAARALLAEASRGDRFALMLARRPPVFVQPEFSGDTDALLAKLDALPAPLGNPDISRAIAEAWNHLRAKGKAAQREIVVLSDMQRHGWADPTTLTAFENVGIGWRADTDRAKSDGSIVPSMRVSPVAQALPTDAPNYSLAPITVSRGMVKIGQRATFRMALRLEHFPRYQKPTAIRVFVNDTKLTDLPMPDQSGLKQGQLPLQFEHRFEQIGRHIVTVGVEAIAGSDALDVDNVRHAIVEVVNDVPALLLDGDTQVSAESSTYFVRKALTNKSDAGVRAVPVTHWRPSEPAKTKPAVIVLADVPSLDVAQQDAIDAHLADGGGVLVAVGPRMAKHFAVWNDKAYRRGEGWLPARLDSVGSSKEPVSPDARTFQHPALELFRLTPDLDMRQTRVNSWCKTAVKPADRSATVARLTNGEPLLIEKRHKKGYVILCTIPLDRQWRSTFPSSWEFPVVMNDLVGWLAGGRGTASVLPAGEPIRIEQGEGASKRLTLQTPEAPARTFDVASWPWVFRDTGAIGRYDITRADGKQIPFAVEPDAGESNLTRCTEDDRRKIRARLPITWGDRDAVGSPSLIEGSSREEIWWLLLIAVLAFLCFEVWMTRRVAIGRGR
ncbi:MAG: VWA domain-containing protein [Gemmataceae bacterium]|nr:VWA domain-containing protein [Gemmataceae bacterium]